jgi:predicted dehydrogenase
MPHFTRRAFLKTAAFASASAALSPLLTGCHTARPAARVAPLNTNAEIGVAVIGFNGRGGDLMGEVFALQEKGELVRVVALCDPDANVLAGGVKRCAAKGHTAKPYRDLREVFADPAVDAVIIATPNHWHSLAAIWAMQAGKHVYVEKPISHNVWEGRKVVEAQAKYGLVCQPGTQSRSSQGIREAVAWVQAGNLGKVKVARGLCYKRRPSIGKVDGPQPIPPGVDYDLWCGPAPMAPLMRKKLHYDWHWVWPTGCGDLGNQGIHQMDIARWFLGESALSPRVVSTGGRLGYVDDGTTPNTQIIFHDYARAPLIFEVRGLPEKTGSDKMDKYMGGSIAVIIECEGGHVLVPNYNSATAFDGSGKEIKKWEGTESHMGNFLKAVRAGNPALQNAPILEGHLSSALCHTGNISYRVGHDQPAAAIREAIRSEPDGEVTYQRMLEHLQRNDVDVSQHGLVLGPVLKMNPKQERFTNNQPASLLLTRAYRTPYVVPAKV